MTPTVELQDLQSIRRRGGLYSVFHPATGRTFTVEQVPPSWWWKIDEEVETKRRRVYPNLDIGTRREALELIVKLLRKSLEPPKPSRPAAARPVPVDPTPWPVPKVDPRLTVRREGNEYLVFSGRSRHPVARLWADASGYWYANESDPDPSVQPNQYLCSGLPSKRDAVAELSWLFAKE